MERLQLPKSEEPIVVEPEVGIDWYAMGYCISHFNERWGLHATSLRKQNIDLLQKGLNSFPSTEEPDREGLNSLPPAEQKHDGLALSYLYISKSEVPVSHVITSLGEFVGLSLLNCSMSVSMKKTKSFKAADWSRRWTKEFNISNC